MPGQTVCLQIGHSASFVGTHLWNATDIVDSPLIDNSVNIRFGSDQSSGASTYAPRLVIIDLKGSLGSLKRLNNFYESEQDSQNISWNGKVDVRKQESYKKNEYLTYLDEGSDDDETDETRKDDKTAKEPSKKVENLPAHRRNFSEILDSSVSVWSDFNSMFYHPRTIVELGGYSHNDSVAPFAIFNQGVDLWESDRDLVCAVMNGIACLVIEGPKLSFNQFAHNVGFPILLLNCSIALLLNISVVFLIGKTSSLVMCLSGVFKDILLVVVSILIWGTPVMPLQVFGYGIALIGLVWYKQPDVSVKQLTIAFVVLSVASVMMVMLEFSGDVVVISKIKQD